MSNCDVGSGGFRLPCNIVAEHGIEDCDHLSHDCDDDDFGFLVGCGEAIVEDFDGGIVSACAESGHVKDVTDWHATAIDAAMAPELTAIEVVRRETDEGGDLLAAHLPKFRQQGDEGKARIGAIGCKGVFWRSCEQLHSTQVCGVSRRRA